MKKISEKDLSLDNQKVSNLSGATDTREETNELICGSKVCTESHYEICCAETVNICPIPESKLDSCTCPATNDSLCDECSNVAGCLTPVETKVDC